MIEAWSEADVARSGLYLPAGQIVHADDALLEYVPAAQIEQTEDSSPLAPLLKCFPTGQSEQVAEPASL